MMIGVVLIGTATGLASAAAAGLGGLGLPLALLAYPAGGMAGTVGAAALLAARSGPGPGARSSHTQPHPARAG
jgi:hypothetical protein